MHEQHLVCINREVPEQTRRTARDVLRARFVSGPSEEKVELFVQNLARWSATPAPLIAHLLRQDVVKRNPMLRTLLERRPGVQAPFGKRPCSSDDESSHGGGVRLLTCSSPSSWCCRPLPPTRSSARGS
jgi:hypothetical protein